MSINGYLIKYNLLWDTWQVSHDEVGTCIAEFDNEQSAKEYCIAG